MKIAQIVVDNREAYRDYGPPAPWFGTAPTALYEGFDLLISEGEPLEVHIISCTQQPVAAPARIGNLFFHSLHVPKFGWLRTGYQGCIRAVRRKLDEICPDVVHAQGTERECAISASFSHYPKALTIHGNLRQIRRLLGRPLWSIMGLQSILEGFVIPRFNGVVCISKYTEDLVASEAKRVWSIPNAVDSRFFSAVRRQPNVPMLFCVGTIDPRKNQIAWIKAIDAIQAKWGFEVRFFGDHSPGSPYWQEFENEVIKRTWCHFGGRLSMEDLFHELEAASALVLPSLEDNCPMVVLEAMAAGVPVVASRVGGIPEMICHAETGLLMDPLDPDDMRSTLSYVIEDPARAEAIGEAGKKYAASVHHPRVIAASHLRAYESLIR